MIEQREIRKLRTEAGLLAREVARAAKLDTGRYSYIESRVVKARPDEMDRIEKALLGLISKRLGALRDLVTSRGLEVAFA